MPFVFGGRRVYALHAVRSYDLLLHDVLDRIDEIVPPGTTLNPAGNGWGSSLRR